MFACCFPSLKTILTATPPVVLDLSGAAVAVATNAIVTDIGVGNAGEEPVDVDTLVSEKK